MAVGKTRSINDFQFELEDVIRSFPKDSVSMKAQEILDFIKGNNVKATAIDTIPVDTNNLSDPFAKSAKYLFDANSMQFFVIIFPKNALAPAELIAKINAFNNIDFTDQQLTVNNGNIDLNLQYIAVMSFESKDDAMTYYQTIISEQNLLDQFDPQLVQYFIISQTNLSELTRTKDMKAYTEFFQQKYLQ